MDIWAPQSFADVPPVSPAVFASLAFQSLEITVPEFSNFSGKCPPANSSHLLHSLPVLTHGIELLQPGHTGPVAL